MINWFGLSSGTTPVDSTRGVSEEQSNTRLKVMGECQRRWGMLTTAIARQAGRILNIVSAHPHGGNYLTFDVEGAGSNSVGGEDPPPPPWQPPKKKKVIVQPPMACATWGPFNSFGEATPLTVSEVLPANSCAGTLTLTGTEDPARPRGDDYGYSFTVDYNGVNAGSSGCLVNASHTIPIPPGTLTIDVHVTPQCVFPLGSQHGTWYVDMTSP